MIEEKSIDVVDGSRIAHKNMKNVLENLTAGDNKTKYPKFLTYFTVFSDVFDPTVSLVKSNRFGVWVLQVCFLRSCENDKAYNTYIISLSGKSTNHEPVLKSLEEDITKLSTRKFPPMYHGGLKNSSTYSCSPSLSC